MPESASELRERLAALERELHALRREVVSRVGCDPPPEGRFAFLACRIGETRAALPLEQIDEVVPIPWLEPLPEAPPWVSGLLDLRGETLPVLDVCARMARGAREAQLSDLVAVARLGARRVGLVVQEVFDVGYAEASELEPAGEVPHAPYLTGILALEDRSLQLLSLARLVESSDLPEAD